MIEPRSPLRPKVLPLHLVPALPAAWPVPAVVPLTRDPRMQRVIRQVERAAACDLPVVMLGESGAGKEILVQHLHASSARANGPFVAENCSAIPESLAESLLFGHVRGSFTGADRDRTGLFAQADGGTLFLDEIGEMPLAMQARLLRVLEERRVRPVGGSKPIPVDVRVVCATNRDLAALVREGGFREDLYYRLAGVSVRIPALRERAGDIQLLADAFLGDLNSARGTQRRFAPDLAARMQIHPWPGNVRELRNTVAALYHMSEGELVDGELPSPDLVRSRTESDSRLVTRVAPLAEIEKEAIQLALAATGGDRREAARRLGISRSTLYVRIRDLGL